MLKVYGVGNIASDIELKSTQSNISFVNFTVAFNRQYKNAQGESETDFLRVIAWRGLSENVAKYCKKGSKVFIEGYITTRNYEKDGNTIYVTEVVADNVQFLDKREDSNHPQTDEQIDNTYKHQKTYNVPKKSSEEQFESNVDASSEDLPF